MNKVNWSKEEIEKFKRMYPYLSNEDLSKIFNRSVVAIQHKGSKRSKETRLKISEAKKRRIRNE